jgi:hypothetical protein
MDNPNDPGRLTADTTGSSFTLPTHAIAPEDQERANRLASFHPLATPSPVTLTGSGSFKAPERFTLSILPPEKQAPIAAQLAQLPLGQREAREHELVTEALKQNSIELRIKAGPGPGATPVERERFLLAREVYDLERAEEAVLMQLGEVEKWVPVYDEITGKPVIDSKTGQQQLVAVQRIQGDRRKAMEARAAEIRHQIALKEGIEGDRRLQRALNLTVEAEKAREEALAIDQEARRLSEEINREVRVKALAEAYAKNRRNSL